MPPINPESAWARIYFDLPTPLAVRFDNAMRSGELPYASKKAALVKAVENLLATHKCGESETPAPSKKKSRAKKGE